ncbi:MAG: hypothetical protein RLZZ540_1070 [Bacteroidota bacterium]|jgi:hypothetical protein
MKKLLLPILFLCSLTCFSQKKDKREGVYSAYLSSVDVPKEMKKGVIDSLSSIYEDDLIKIDWGYAISQIEFELKNKSDQTLKIIWDDAAFISISNESGRIFHKGIKYIDRENSQPSTSVYKGTILSDLVLPTSFAYLVPGQYGGWRSLPLIPIIQSTWSKKIEYKPELIGQTMRVILPLKIEEKLIEYVFSFKTKFIEKK